MEQLTVTEAGGVIALSGELDLSNVDLARAGIASLDGNRPIRLDLSELEFMDSQGLRLLIELNEAKGLRIVGVSRPVRRVMDIAGLTERLMG